MPPANFDAIIQDVSKTMAKSQFLRRLSANSSNASASSKRDSKRVAKVKSVGNSPHNIVQRRKTTASHSSRTSHSAAQDYSCPVSEQSMEDCHPLQGMLPSARPMSWHPGSRAHDDAWIEPFLPNEPAMKNAIAGFRNLAVVGNEASSHDRLTQNTLPANPPYPINDLSTTYGQSSAGMEGYGFFESNAENTYPPYPPYSLAGQNHYFNNPFPYAYPAYSSEGLQEPAWQQNPSNFAAFPGPQPSDRLSAQNPLDHAQIPEANIAPQIPRQGNKELWGMGLYDHNASSLDFSASPPLHFAILDRQSIGTGGKGLKLEETWAPSKITAGENASNTVKQEQHQQDEDEEEVDEEEEEEEEEAYSTDEADEDFVPIMDPLPGTEPQAVLYPAYGDLSNQTFFFDSDDPYTDCVAFDHQAVRVCQQPKMPDAAYGGSEHSNFLWI